MQTKRTICLLLSVLMVLGMLSGCGSSQPESANNTQEPAATPEPLPALSETLQQVCDLGIADIEVLARAEDICTRAEAVDMLARVYEMRKGEKSLYLNDMASAFG